MPTGAVIVLIIVVWLFVLAPWLLRSQRPVGHTGEGFEDTRVLFSGDSGHVPAAPRPRLSAADVRTQFDASDDEQWELVEASAADAVPASGDQHVQAMVDGEVVTPAAAIDAKAASEDDASEDDVLVDDTAEFLHLRADDAPVEEDRVEEFSAPVVSATADAYALNESYTSPVDLMYPGAVDVHAAEDESDNDDEDVTEEADATAVPELTAEELAFAQRRRGRGCWDPVADKEAGVTRYQRRQRILAVLAVLVVATVCLGIMTTTWWPAIITGVATVLYLVTLRNQTRAEQALRRRRIAALRRARMGVRNEHDEELAIPRRLRHPGAVVLEADDESPDFEFLQLVDSDVDPEDLGGGRVINRRMERDELSARRVS